MKDITRRSVLHGAAAAVVSQKFAAAAAAEPAAKAKLYTGSPVEVYTGALSAVAGDDLTIHVSTIAKRFTLQIARVGLEETLVWEKKGLSGTFHPTPSDAWERGCRWPPAVRIKVPSEWKSGYYQIKAIVNEGQSKAEFLAFVVIRAERPASRILFVLSTNTYGAYNAYGGANLYQKRDGKADIKGGEHRISFLRPWLPGFLWKPADYDVDAEINSGDFDFSNAMVLHRKSGIPYLAGVAGFHNWERVMVRWLEKNGYDVEYAINSDLEYHPDLLKKYRLMLSVGHDEYWSWAMRDTLEGFVSAGGNACFLSGNISYWQVRMEDQGRSMVCYKGNYQEDPFFKAGKRRLTTTVWSSHIIARPETRMTGLSYWYAGFSRFRGVVAQGPGGYLVYRPDHWVFKDSGMNYGDCLGQSSIIVHYEVDGCPIRMQDGIPYPADFHDGPTSLTILGMVPAALDLRDFGGNELFQEHVKEVFGTANPNAVRQVGRNQGHAVMSIYTDNGTVFCAGTTDWTNGLKGKDPAVERVTKNLVDRLSS